MNGEANSKKQWMSAAQAAEYLSLTRKALYQAVYRGEIPVYRLGRRLRFRREELDRVLMAQRVCNPLAEEISLLLS